ncbi:alpha/beta fold hydrolase [Tropicibacter oceani]|uniref:Alpha/beta fold hydrolase n=1 Tax=Tropicibacter oceani TaxID=3058420 RepID=A0ABY8QKI6_9RHOB|nr:alpha/beta fold hydrolase [Tropicibacter oceani]WGW04523.1 alpha/beta fold hydrolase [Tropicibacter oceani]
MLYEVAFPALYLGAKTRQMSRRTRARLGLAPADMARVTYHPESYYRVACWHLRRLDVQLMMTLAPFRAARLSIERFERIRQMPDRPGVEAPPPAAEHQDVKYRGKRVHLSFYGPEDGPKILALHGWNGRASMMRKLVTALAGQGFRVVVPDLPGHGRSEGNRYSFYDLGQAMADLFLGTRFRAVIGHSAGGLIAGFAIGRGLRADCYIPVGAPASLSNLLKSYVEITQMPARALPYIERYYIRRYGVSPEDVGTSLLSRLPVRTLVVHETRDWQVGVENAHELANAAMNGELFLTTGHTHLSVLNAPEVHDRIVSFITRGRHV